MGRYKLWHVRFFGIVLTIAPVTVLQAATPAKSSEAPRVFLLDAQHLLETRQRVRNGDKNLAPALTQLEQEAQEALLAGPFSVTDKRVTPSSGDKRDYMSMGPYWWPNPDTPDGLPYIHRDGVRNPEMYLIPDHQNLDEMAAAVETLSLAWYFLGDEIYAARATDLVHTWFFDPNTRMNPNLKFGQAIPGITEGRGIGLIETPEFTRVTDAAGLLADSKSWTKTEDRKLREWIGDYLQWMLESKNGHDEAAKENNHGTYYDLQVASYALYLEKMDLARKILEAVKEKRIAFQIQPDGRQPPELIRTKSWGYSLKNLRGLIALAALGEHAGVDLWHYRTTDGRSIRKAVDFLIPYSLGREVWPYRQLGGLTPTAFYPILRQAAAHYSDGPYESLLAEIPKPEPTSRIHLLGPDIIDVR